METQNPTPKPALPSDNKRSGWKLLLLVLFCGLLLRLALLAWFQGVLPGITDEADYINLAEELAVTGNYAQQGLLVSLRPPLYPAMMAEVYRAVGMEEATSREMHGLYHAGDITDDGQESPASPHRHAGMRDFQAMRLLQIFISLATACVVYFTARLLPELLSQRAALTATAMFCFYPSLVGMNFLLLSETLFLFFLTLLIFSGVKFLRTGSLLAAGFLGVFIALGALTRSILWMTPVPVAVFILFFATHISMKKRLTATVVMTLFAAVMMAPWIIRNTKVQETFTAIDCMSGRNLMMGNYENTPKYRAWAAVEIPAPDDWYTMLSLEHFQKTGNWIHGLSQGEKDRLAGKYAMRYIWNHPGQTIKRDAVKACCFWQLERSFPAGAMLGMFGFDRFPPQTKTSAVLTLTAVILAAYVFLLASAVFGAFAWKPVSDVTDTGVKTVRQLWLILVFFVCIILYFWGIHTLIFAHERYHLPLIPILCIFAAMFWSAPREKLSVLFSLKRRWLPACMFLLTLCVFWAVELAMAARLMVNG